MWRNLLMESLLLFMGFLFAVKLFLRKQLKSLIENDGEGAH
jgi:hypothetical protein